MEAGQMIDKSGVLSKTLYKKQIARQGVGQNPENKTKTQRQKEKCKNLIRYKETNGADTVIAIPRSQVQQQKITLFMWPLGDKPEQGSMGT